MSALGARGRARGARGENEDEDDDEEEAEAEGEWGMAAAGPVSARRPQKMSVRKAGEEAFRKQRRKYLLH